MSDILTGTASDLAQLDARMQILARNRTNDGVLAIDKDAEDAVKIETPIAGVSDIVRQSLEILAAMNRTPAVKLLGISPSGFNATGESDIRNYYDHISSQQEKVIRNPLKAILDVAQVSLWGEADAGLTFDFCPLSVVDDNSAAVTQQTKINTLCALIDRNVISVEEARQVLADDPESGFDELDPDAVPDAGGMEDAGGAEPPAQEGETADTGENVARPFEVTSDSPEWKTADNGKKIQIETATGEILKGKIGQSEEIFGPAFPAFKGKPNEAIEHLLKEKRGHVPGAFHKEGLGDIDLPYGHGGKKGFGLAHIIERRNQSGVDGENFVRSLPTFIKKGRVEKREGYPGRAYIVYEKMEAAIRLDWNGEERNWVVTAYPQKIEKTGAQDGCRTCVLAFDDKQSFPLPYSG